MLGRARPQIGRFRLPANSDQPSGTLWVASPRFSVVWQSRENLW
jgi:hypothetical protein